jgi:hypothetical protein
MAAFQGPFPILQLPEGLLDRMIGCLELWDLAAARAACRAMRSAAGRRARRLCFSPLKMQCEHGYVQVGCGQPRQGLLLVRGGTLAHCRPPAARMLSERQGMHPSRPLPSPHPPQTARPTSFQLFPNAREVELQPREWVYPEGNLPFKLRLDVPAVFRLPEAPADAAAARAALAGVTRLEVLGGVLDPEQLAAVLLHLPGLRAVSLVCNECSIVEGGAVADWAAALASCPRLESLEWYLTGWLPAGA